MAIEVQTDQRPHNTEVHSVPIDLSHFPPDPTLTAQVLADRRRALTKLGVSSLALARFEKRFPTLIDPEVIARRLRDFQEIGLLAPEDMVRQFPNIITLTPENIMAKIVFLKELGFSDPFQMINVHPVIISYSTENIKATLEHMRASGIKDPIKLIRVQPRMLGLSTERISSRLELLRRLARLYRFSVKPADLVEQNPGLLAISHGRLMLLIRILKTYRATSTELTKQNIGNLLSKNIDDIVYGYLSGPQRMQPVTNLFTHIKNSKAKEKGRPEKRAMIASHSENSVATSYLRYFPD